MVSRLKCLQPVQFLPDGVSRALAGGGVCSVVHAHESTQVGG